MLFFFYFCTTTSSSTQAHRVTLMKYFACQIYLTLNICTVQLPNPPSSCPIPFSRSGRIKDEGNERQRELPECQGSWSDEWSTMCSAYQTLKQGILIRHLALVQKPRSSLPYFYPLSLLLPLQFHFSFRFLHYPFILSLQCLTPTVSLFLLHVHILSDIGGNTYTNKPRSRSKHNPWACSICKLINMAMDHTYTHTNAHTPWLWEPLFSS